MECGPKLMDPVRWYPVTMIGAIHAGHQTFFPSYLREAVDKFYPSDAVIKEYRSGI